MAGGDLGVRPLSPDERAAWEPLWNGYLTFYETVLPQEATDIAWRRMHDPAEPMFGLGAYADGALVGIVHYLFHRSFWTVGNYCYLQDLFVTEAARKSGVGAVLLREVYKLADEIGAAQVFWLADQEDAPLSRFYDRYAMRTHYIRFMRHRWPWYAEGQH